MTLVVQAPQRKPRIGGIKSVVGEFIETPRLSAHDDVVFEQQSCNFPNASRAGCMDDTFAGEWDGVVVFLGDANLAIQRTGDLVEVTVTVPAKLGGGGQPEQPDVESGALPWAPLDEAATVDIDGLILTIDTDGSASWAGEITDLENFEGGEETVTYEVAHAELPFKPDGTAYTHDIGDTFAQYAGVECYIGGDDTQSYAEQARAVLEAGEDRMVELNLWTWASSGGGSSASNLADAIGTAEDLADQEYVGAPVIIMSRLNATRAKAGGVLSVEDGKLVTANGTPVLATGQAGSQSIAIVGAPAVYATPVLVVEAKHHVTNRDMAIAQRAYSIGIDCAYRTAITITS